MADDNPAPGREAAKISALQKDVAHAQVRADAAELKVEDLENRIVELEKKFVEMEKKFEPTMKDYAYLKGVLTKLQNSTRAFTRRWNNRKKSELAELEQAASADPAAADARAAYALGADADALAVLAADAPSSNGSKASGRRARERARDRSRSPARAGSSLRSRSPLGNIDAADSAEE